MAISTVASAIQEHITQLEAHRNSAPWDQIGCVEARTVYGPVCEAVAVNQLNELR